MHGKITNFFSILVLIFIIASCDSFSLLDQFGKSEDNSLSLVVQNSTLKPGEESMLYPNGGTAPYFFAIVIDDFYDDGHDYRPGIIVDQMYTAGLSIGGIRIHLTDSAGGSVDSPVTIIPWKPLNFNADGTAVGPTTIELTWDYYFPGYIGGFRIFRSVDGVSFIEIVTTGSAIRTYLDESANPQMNYYRIYAVAGVYESAYAEASGMGGSR